MSNTLNRGGQATDLTTTYLQTEFFAEDTMISIVPSFESGQLNLVCGDFGPFRPSIAIEVPLWLALTFKKLHKCNIQPPQWLEVDALEEKLKAERTSTLVDDQDYGDVRGAELQRLPKYFSQIATLLLHQASDDLRDPDQIRRLVEDIQTVRSAKLRLRLQQDIKLPLDAYAMGNLTALEIDANRAVVTKIMTDLYRYGGGASLGRGGSATGTFSASAAADAESATMASPVSATAVRPRQLRRIQRNA